MKASACVVLGSTGVDMTDNDIVRRGYLNVVRNPQGGVVRDGTTHSTHSTL